MTEVSVSMEKYLDSSVSHLLLYIMFYLNLIIISGCKWSRGQYFHFKDEVIDSNKAK